MKKFLSLALTILLLFTIVTLPVHAASLYYYAEAYLVIDGTGHLSVTVSYEAVPNMVSEVLISVKIQKRTALLFWRDYDSWNYHLSSTSYNNTHALPQPVESGTYRMKADFTFKGIDGSTETVNLEDVATY